MVDQLGNSFGSPGSARLPARRSCGERERSGRINLPRSQREGRSRHRRFEGGCRGGRTRSRRGSPPMPPWSPPAPTTDRPLAPASLRVRIGEGVTSKSKTPPKVSTCLGYKFLRWTCVMEMSVRWQTTWQDQMASSRMVNSRVQSTWVTLG